MCPRVGNRFQSKANTASRSSIVLRFLAGCQPEELGMFIDLLLEPVCHHAEGTDLNLSFLKLLHPNIPLKCTYFAVNQIVLFGLFMNFI